MYTQTCCKVKVMHPVSRTAWVSGNIAVGFGGAVQASLRSESLFGRIVMVYALLRPRSQLQRLGLTVCKTQVKGRVIQRRASSLYLCLHGVPVLLRSCLLWSPPS